MSVAMLRSSPAGEAKVPRTPMRKFICGKVNFLRPSMTLGKRDRVPATHVLPSSENHSSAQTTDGVMEKLRDICNMSLDPTPRTRTITGESIGSLSRSSSFEKAHEKACLAIQHHDKPLDAVVVTALPRYPFCCHEDLLTMSRQQLVEAAILFNNHLPLNAQIDCSESATDANIRHHIETMVGIVPEIPGAPKAVKSRNNKFTMATLLEDTPLESLPSPPSSPLAMRFTRKRGSSSISIPFRILGRLEEEDKADFFAKQRTTKKRKVSQFIAEPTRFLFENNNFDMEITPMPHLSFSSSVEMLFSPVLVEDVLGADHNMVFLAPPRDCNFNSGVDSYTHTRDTGTSPKSVFRMTEKPEEEPEDSMKYPRLVCENFAKMELC